jgi:hypothetical protein
MQRACLQEAEWILKGISICKERQVTSDEVRRYVLPALKDAFQESQSACEVYEFVCSLARMQAEFDPSFRLLCTEGRRYLGNILMSAEFKRDHVPEQVRSMSAWLIPDCPCFT